MTNKNFNLFRHLRKKKNLTQMQLSKILNVDQTTISKWELGKAIPDHTMLIKLSDYFDVSIDYLLERSQFYYPDKLKEKEEGLSTDERELLACYRELTPSFRELALSTLRTWTGSDTANANKRA